MALIDEYKKAIQDVLDGRAPDAPKPSELPWSEDKLATIWAAAAAELIAEAAIPEPPSPELPADPGTDGTYNLQNTVEGGTGTLSWASGGSGGDVLVVNGIIDGQNITLDKTWSEIATAGFSVMRATVNDSIMWGIIDYVSVLDSGADRYVVFVNNNDGEELSLATETANGYPTNYHPSNA